MRGGSAQLLNKTGKIGKVSRLTEQAIGVDNKLAHSIGVVELEARATEALLAEINKFKSRTQASEVAMMVAAYDPVTGLISVGKSNPAVNAASLDPVTIAYLRKQLKVDVGDFTNFCKNRVGSCAEVMAADALVRQGVNPKNISFTYGVRPRTEFNKPNTIFNEVHPMCDNCRITWPKGR